MNKTLLIIQREYITRVRKKSFIIFTLLGPVFFLLISLLPILISNANKSDQHILVKDDSGLIPALPDTAGLYFTYKYQSIPVNTLKTDYSTIGEGYDAFLYIPAMQPDAPYGIEIYSNEQVSLTTKLYIESIIADKLETINLQQHDLDKNILLKLRPKVDIDDKVTSGESQKEGNAAIASAFGFGMGFIIYIVLLIYGTMVMRGVMEEKSSRIIEVIISSVKPFQLMMGKIVGIGLVGLTQFVAWGFLITILNIIIGVLFAGQLSDLQQVSASGGEVEMNAITEAMQSMQNIPIGYYLSMFIIYFLGGYFIYASLFAAIGSLAGDEEGDVQTFAFPVTMLILVSIFIMMAVVQQPHTPLAFWASIIPLSSPIVMPALIPFGVPTWQIVLSIVLLFGGFIFTTFLAGRIYRTAILMYGKKIKVKEVFKWMFYK
ncbi:MAG: ABC transporter permease [Chitinophagaceae bacterium]|nr:ABC transporter permease [Bacteroidota bacterium]MBL0279850.1 ABC transporter permease [Bacteroidota bacterium]